MAELPTIKTPITADDKTKAGIDSASKNIRNYEKTTQAASARIQAHWIKVQKAALAVAAVAYTAKKAWDFTEEAAKFKQSTEAFNSMVAAMGRNAEVELGRIKTAAAGLIDDKTVVEASARAMSLGIPIEKVGELMEVARARARDMGISTTQAFNDIVTGIGRGSPMILDNLGLVLKVGEANNAYAKSLGKTAKELSSKEQKMAILNAVLEAGSESLARHNLSTKTMAENMEAAKAALENVKLAVAGLLTNSKRLSNFIEDWANGMKIISDYFTTTKQERIAQVRAEMEKLQETIAKVEKQRIIKSLSKRELEAAREKVAAYRAELAQLEAQVSKKKKPEEVTGKSMEEIAADEKWMEGFEDKRFNLIVEAQRREREFWMQNREDELYLEKENEDRLTAIHADALKSRLDLEKKTNAARKQAMGLFYANLGAIGEQYGQTAFGMAKVLAGSETAINTIASAQAAYKALAGIPIIGPALGAGAALAAIAAGMARVNQIKNMSLGQGAVATGGGTPSVSTPTTVAPAVSPAVTSPPVQEQMSTSTRYEIHVHGDALDPETLAAKLAEHMKGLKGDGHDYGDGNIDISVN
jgi:hypothetical protein